MLSINGDLDQLFSWPVLYLKVKNIFHQNICSLKTLFCEKRNLRKTHYQYCFVPIFPLNPFGPPPHHNFSSARDASRSPTDRKSWLPSPGTVAIRLTPGSAGARPVGNSHPATAKLATLNPARQPTDI